MCIKYFHGFACGHCSVPWIVKCPTAQADESFPVCAFPAEHPLHQPTVCHPCSRVLWNADVLQKENAHKKLHREGQCKCETVFPDLHDTNIRPQYNWAQPATPLSPLQSEQTQFAGPNAYMNYLSSNPNSVYGIAAVSHSEQRPESQEQYQSAGEWARQYVHDRPDQRLYYDHVGNIFLFDPDTPGNYFVQLPEGLRDINELPPVPAHEENGRYDFPGAWARRDFLKLDHEKLRYGQHLPGTPLDPYGLHRNDAFAPWFGIAGSSNYAGSNNAPTFAPGSPAHAQQQIPASSAPPKPYYARIPSWQFRGPADWGNARTEALIAGAQQPVSAYSANGGYGGVSYRPATYGNGSRYYPNPPAPSSSSLQPTKFPGSPTQVPNVRQFPVPASSSNIEALTQFENINIGSGVPEWKQQQSAPRQGAMRAQGRSMRATHFNSRSPVRISEAMNVGGSEGSYTPKVKLPATGNAAEGSSAPISSAPSTPNTPNVEYSISERVSGIFRAISDDSEGFSAPNNVENDTTSTGIAKSTSLQQPSAITAPSSPEITSPVTLRKETIQ